MKKLTIGILMGFSALVQTTEASADRFHPHHLFVKMKQGQSLAQSPLIKSSKKLFGRLYLVKTDHLAELSEELSQDSGVEYTQKDFFAEKRIMPKHEVLDEVSFKLKNFFSRDNLDQLSTFNDPEVSRLWAFNATAGMDVLGAYAALPAKQSKQVIVAVVDTGVDYNHEDLKDIMWVNKGEVAGDGIDNDNNGYVDDVYGINTLVRNASGAATTEPMASHWHGTHVSGTIAATQNNGKGIAGVANNVKIMAIRTVPDNADELDSDIVEAFLYAAKMGAKVINCSFGKEKNEGGMVVRDTITEIGQKYNVLVVASAGNDSMGPMVWRNNDADPKFPASFDSENLLVVASTTSSGSLSSFTNIGNLTVDVAAPGSNVYSTVKGNSYAMASGTSMAAPNTSGVAAMVLGYYPNLSAIELKNVLIQSVTKVPTFRNQMVSGGRVNLKNALAAAKEISHQK